MPRRLALLLALALVAAACGGPSVAGDTASTEAAPSQTVADSVPTGDDSTASEPTPTSEGTTDAPAVGPPVSGFDGPPAPSDAVPFAGGNDIELSQEVLPVYLVFWAEW